MSASPDRTNDTIEEKKREGSNETGIEIELTEEPEASIAEEEEERRKKERERNQTPSFELRGLFPFSSLMGSSDADTHPTPSAPPLSFAPPPASSPFSLSFLNPNPSGPTNPTLAASPAPTPSAPPRDHTPEHSLRAAPSFTSFPPPSPAPSSGSNPSTPAGNIQGSGIHEEDDGQRRDDPERELDFSDSDDASGDFSINGDKLEDPHEGFDFSCINPCVAFGAARAYINKRLEEFEHDNPTAYKVGRVVLIGALIIGVAVGITALTCGLGTAAGAIGFGAVAAWHAVAGAGATAGGAIAAHHTIIGIGAIALTGTAAMMGGMYALSTSCFGLFTPKEEKEEKTPGCLDGVLPRRKSYSFDSIS